ncbi:hypothetical protein M408DRAFT_330219 [Serendipita vermifera MAFF 305830]|uniref:PLD phosphodiesterase domain-containing protein n=1 Tax=Serendipita vermifera MAFF 305830 TaxID=933852 RepID=A0A0C2XDE2_SERVB|nr:hypothetical protein M408DRAFT_330219 [Serendipita vermifera MAFF 305830]
MSDIEDDELAAAIAASVETFHQQETRNRPTENDRIGQDADADDEFEANLKSALEESKAEATKQSNPSTSGDRTPDIKAVAPSTSEPVASNPASEFLRQRALLEKERLERNKGRFPSGVANTSTSGHTNSSNRPGQKRTHSMSQSDEDDEEDEEPPQKRKTSTAVGSTTAGNSSGNGEGELFYEHELRQTANMHTEARDKKEGVKTFRLTEIIGNKREISFAILSSYSTDVSWLYSLFDPETPVILINQPRDAGQAEVHNILPNWIMTMPPMRGGKGAMHVKLMLLFYKSGHLRVGIPTANFIDYDWRDIENTVWVQDFPPLTKPIVGRDAVASSFSYTLQMVLNKLHVPAALQSLFKEHPNLPVQNVEDLGKRWAFGRAKVKLIPSMAGKHQGWDQVLKQGHVALMKGIIDIGAHADQTKRKSKIGAIELLVECQGSSIGQYSAHWLQAFYSSCQGISPERYLDKSQAARARLPTPLIRILFPSLKTVKESVLGTPGGGTMFCRQNQWDSANFPRALFHDSNSKRGGVLMHTKMILGLWKPKSNRTGSIAASMSKGKGKRDAPIEIDLDEEEEEEESEDQDIEVIEPEAAGWLYVGSHNFTPSAWGTFPDTATGFTPILNITNYELGVLIPLSEQPAEAEKQANQLVSWVRPPRKYNLAAGSGKVDTPWIQERLG